MTIRNLLPACILTALILTPHAANAEARLTDQLRERAAAVVTTLKTACEDDLKNYCSKVTPRDAHIAYCMLAHEDKISDKCANAVVSVVDQMEMKMSKLARVAETCKEDIRKACETAGVGNGNLMKCLRDQRDRLSVACRTDVTD
jgi:enamine deaminase RidA (YjgF/YER057c/UK114 family)